MYRKAFRVPYAKRGPSEDGPPTKKQRLSPEPGTERNVAEPPPPVRQLPVTGSRIRPSTQAPPRSQLNATTSTSEAVYYNCLWYAHKKFALSSAAYQNHRRKQQFKKNKTWDGDGILVVKDLSLIHI